MKLILVFTIYLCWSEIYARKCFPKSECEKLMKNDWNDPKRVPLPLSPSEQNSFDQNTGSRQQMTLSVPDPGVRKECRTLSDEERNLLFSAFQWLFINKTSPSDTLTRYRVFMSQHRRAQAPGAHFGPDFPGWHREFLLSFERELQLYNNTINLCYWDSSLDRLLPYAEHSALWTSEYLGNGLGYVTTGFAANQTAYPSDCVNNWPRLYRDIGGGNDYLYDQSKFTTIFNSAYSFTQLMKPYTSSKFENYHGEVHVFVGGHMSIISCAVLDPVFWFHHTFIDYLWEKCRQIQTTNKEQDYPTGSTVPTSHRANDTMRPFMSKICINGLSNSYIPGLYSYAPSPGNCTTHSQCGGKALWCNNGTCMACVGLNGQMGTNWPNQACYITGCLTPQNVNQFCKCGP